MSARDFCFIAFRMLGVYFVVSMLVQGPAVAALLWRMITNPGYEDPLLVVLSLVLSSFPGVVGLLLWFKAYSLTDKLFGDLSVPVFKEELVGKDSSAHSEIETDASDEEQAEVTLMDDRPIRLGDIHAVLYSIAGIIILSTAFPDLISMIWYTLTEPSDTSPFGVLDDAISRPVNIVVTNWAPLLARLALGIWLFLGSKGIVGFWNRTRSRKKDESITDTPDA